MSDLAGKTILVTGASMGIGEAVVREMARRGAHLILVSRHLDQLESVRLSLPDPEKHRSIACDVTSQSDIENFVRQVTTLDGLIPNAGAILYEKFSDMTDAQEAALFDLNFFSVLRLTRKLLPVLEKGKDPTILLVSSAASWRALPLWSAYCASKAALTSWAEALRLELKPKGIRVVTVYPGVTKTALSDNASGGGAKPFATTEGKGATPEWVAHRAVKAYESGRRDEWMGFFNRIYRWASFLCPGLLDRYFESYYRKKGWLT